MKLKLRTAALTTLFAAILSTPAMAYSFVPEVPLYYIYFLWALHPTSIVTIPIFMTI